MDIELLKTFLEVNRTRHFGRASENLFLTQSAVSARVRLLEETLGMPLFTRTRNDIQLTPAGSRLVKYAESILNTWNRARQEAALGAEEKGLLAVGGVPSLWDILLQEWIHALHRTLPGMALQAEAAGQEVLVRRLLDGALDLACMWEPPQVGELLVEEMGSIQLVLVASRRQLSARAAIAHGYVMVDWGTSFAMAHARHYPDMAPPAVRVGQGRMALAFLLDQGGAAYLAEPMVREHLDAGRLHRMADAPVIDRVFHAVFPPATGQRRILIDQALGLLGVTGGLRSPAPAPAA